MEDGMINTGFDDLISSLKASGSPLSIAKLASICNVPSKTVLEWAHILEKDGKAEIINRFDGVYVSWASKPSSHERLSPLHTHQTSQQDFDAQISLAREREAKMAQEKQTPGAISTTSTIPTYTQAPIAPTSPAPIPSPSSTARPSSSAVPNAPITPKQQIDAARGELSALDNELSKVENAIERLERMKDFETQMTSISEIEREENETASEKVAEVERQIIAPVPRRREDKRQAYPQDKNDAAIESQSTELVDSLAQMPIAEETLRDGEQAESKAQPEKPKFSAINYLSQKISKGKNKSRFEKIKKPPQLKITETSVKFSERMERQLRKIEKQAREVEVLRSQKEQLLNEHYLPMQRRLESEIETISDRIVKIENGVFGLQKRASDLPMKVGAVEKIQSSTINAHSQMRKAYDEASALVEQAGIELADEISKLEELAEQCRHEISGHSAKTVELKNTLERIDVQEGEISYQVSAARSLLAEQAEKLESAEKYATELAKLRSEIAEEVDGMKREISSTKGVLTNIESQVGQIRHVREWAGSMKDEYEAKMQEIDDYVKNGNAEFELLRDSVESRFVQKYLRELRMLSGSYTFELNQAKATEADLDSRIAGARQRLDELIDEGQKIAAKEEGQLPSVADAGQYGLRAQTFEGLNELEAEESKVAQMIAQVVGRKTEHVSAKPLSRPVRVGISLKRAPRKARKSAAKKVEKKAISKKTRIKPRMKPGKAGKARIKVRKEKNAKAHSKKKGRR